MPQAQAFGRQGCSLLAVLCGQLADRPRRPEVAGCRRRRPSYPFPDLVSSGRLEVRTLVNPTTVEFCEVQKSLQPNILYLQGEQLEDEEQIGSLNWGDTDDSEPEMLSSLISPPLPGIVYLEVPEGGKIAQAFHSKGVPYVIYWKNAFSAFAASHFRQAWLSVVQSSCSHTWDAFHLAHASFRLYCVRNYQVSLDCSQKISPKLGPHLLGDPPKINIPTPEKIMGEKDEEGLPEIPPAVKIFYEDTDLRFLICGVQCPLDNCLLGSLEDGLNALLNIEIRGSKLQNRVSVAPPPLQAGNYSRGVLTMRCDITTCSIAHISLLVSASAQNCFDNQLLEHIKSELIEKSQLIHALPRGNGDKPSSLHPLNSVSVACGSSVIEVNMKVPTWAAQVLKQLAPEVSYRSFATLGITSIQGTPVASFDKEDADRLLFFCGSQGRDFAIEDSSISCPPRLFSSLTKCTIGAPESIIHRPYNKALENGLSCRSSEQHSKTEKRLKRESLDSACSRQMTRVSATRPIPRCWKHKMLPFSGVSIFNANDGQMQMNIPVKPPVKHNVVRNAPVTRKKFASSSSQSQQMIPLNPLPMKKHGCNRAPIQVCAEEEFLKDVMQFLIVKGHSRLIPQGGISEFPDVILNTKRLDLYNLYREVVSRGGFYVGNGINWKGQIFSKMRNHTATNRMTGVGNTLKRHYETYLLEYELAHDDVGGECCLLCHSSAPGDWVNCGLCGEWAHFGCDRRLGLGTFKDYAKTDGLEYICPHCSSSNYKKKQQKVVSNGFSNVPTDSRHV